MMMCVVDNTGELVTIVMMMMMMHDCDSYVINERRFVVRVRRHLSGSRVQKGGQDISLLF